MASKAQRAAVRSRADKVNAAIGSFCKERTILPLVGNWIEAPPAPEEVSISSVFDSAPLSADPDLYMATMTTETPIQRDMVLDMLHNLSPDAEGNVAYSPYANDVLADVLTHKSE
jgi:hypothetical protein